MIHINGYRYNEGTWNQSKLYILTKKECNIYLNNEFSLPIDDNNVLIDANLLSKDGTSQLQTIYHSENGELLAYCISKKGSDWVEIHLKV